MMRLKRSIYHNIEKGLGPAASRHGRLHLSEYKSLGIVISHRLEKVILFSKWKKSDSITVTFTVFPHFRIKILIIYVYNLYINIYRKFVARI